MLSNFWELFIWFEQELMQVIPINKWLIRTGAIIVAVLVALGIKLIAKFNMTSALIGGGIILMTLIPTFLLVQYITKDNVFDKDGNAKCCALTLDGKTYEEVPCHWKKHPLYGTPVEPFNTVKLRKNSNIKSPNFKVRSIDKDTFNPFDPITGEPLVWYYKYSSGELEFFDTEGFHSKFGEKLKPIDKTTALELFTYLENGNTDMIVNNTTYNRIKERYNVGDGIEEGINSLRSIQE